MREVVLSTILRPSEVEGAHLVELANFEFSFLMQSFKLFVVKRDRPDVKQLDSHLLTRLESMPGHHEVGNSVEPHHA